MANPNLLILEDAATKLRNLVEEVVFVGGATLGLHITDLGAASVRPTIDVDVIAKIATKMEYFDFSERLRAYNFNEDSREGAPICRWLNKGLILDVMPIDKDVLGFCNLWYKDSLHSAQVIRLPGGMSIRVISAVYFLGTKIEAFRGRGDRDFYASRDLEDFVAVIDGRPTIRGEITRAPFDIKTYLAEAVRQLLSESRFMDALPGYLSPDEASQQRLPSVLRTLELISKL